MNNNIQIPDSFNRLSAYLDGRLSPDEMLEMDRFVSKDPLLSAIVADIEVLDQSIVDSLEMELPYHNMDLSETYFPEIETSNEDFFSVGGSLGDINDSLYLESFVGDEIQAAFPLDDALPTDDNIYDNTFDDLL